MTTPAVLSPSPYQQFFNPNGTPLAYGKLATYEAGTATPIATYTDSTGAVQNPNPIILSAFGTCPLWITPNVAYKYVLSDSNGNLIPGGTVDNVTNAQLLSLYGGVDTGAANAYILTFIASFSAYANGTVIYWIPAHTNTGASTMNVNGLGTVPLVNIDGSALGAGEIVAGTTAAVMYYQGSFQLLSIGSLSGVTVGTFGPSTTLASAATTTLANASGHVASVTGITSITSFGAASLLAPIYSVTFTGSLSLIYNGTSMILPGGQTIQTQAGDSCIAQYLGSNNWQVLIYQDNTPTVFTVGKPGVTTVTSNTTLAADPDLTLALPVASIYSLEGWINDLTGTSSGGLKGCLAYSGTVTSGGWAMNGTGTAITTVPLTALGSSAEMQSAQDGDGSMSLSGMLQAGTSGTLSFNWAQESSNATGSVVGVGSWLRATRLLVNLTAVLTPAAVSSIGSGTTQTTASMTCSGLGGTGSYVSYSWTGGSGTIAIDTPSAATTTFTGSSMSHGNVYSITPSCTVTDSSSHTATATGAVTINCIVTPTLTTTLTAAELLIGSNIYGYGYTLGYAGSLSTTVDTNGNTVYAIYTYTGNGSPGELVLSIQFSSNPGSGYFTNLSIAGTNYTSATATYTWQAGSPGYGLWTWPSAPGFTPTDMYAITYT